MKISVEIYGNLKLWFQLKVLVLFWLLRNLVKKIGLIGVCFKIFKFNNFLIVHGYFRNKILTVYVKTNFLKFKDNFLNF